MTYDLIIRGGSVIDGTGSPARTADIGIRNGKIATIGKLAEPAGEIIDASGAVVTPGFVDGHTHFDAQINWDPMGSCASWHGVTSVVMGNCGFTLAPSRADARALVVRNLERAEDISPAAMAQGITWAWETFPEYLDVLEKMPKGINHAVYVGHSALRTWAMGERAFEQQANAEDLALMGAQLRAGMQAGALGLSTSRSMHHETSDNRPVASRVADWSEIQNLVGIVGQNGGIFELAMSPAMRSTDPQERAAALNQLGDLAVYSRAQITFGITPAASPTDEVWQAHLDLLDQTAARGGSMYGQSHSRDITILLSFRTMLAFDKLPEWRDLRALPLDEQARQFRDPARRAQLVKIANEGPYGRAIGAEARKPNWDHVFLYDRPLPPFRSIASLATERGMDPADLVIQLGLDSNFDVWFMQFQRNPGDDAVLPIMRHPRAIMTFSDTGAHVGQIADFCIQTHLLAYWALRRKEFTLEQAVRMITDIPARAWGFEGRGRIAEGMAADLNIFDPSRLDPGLPEIARDIPGGERRLIMRPNGFLATIVAGQPILRDSKPTGNLPGRLLRRRASGMP